MRLVWSMSICFTYSIVYNMRLLLPVTLLLLLCFKPSYQNPSELLNVSLYYEALCPDCSEFIVEQLYPAYHKIGSFMQLELVPYGNIIQKKVNGSWVFECQHGPDECAINKLEACGLARSSHQDRKLEFAYCVELNAEADRKNLTALSECAGKLGISGNEILECSEGAEGIQLLAELGEKQRQLKPTVQYVPWILFNDKYDKHTAGHAIKNFLKTACKFFDQKPEGCIEDNSISDMVVP